MASAVLFCVYSPTRSRLVLPWLQRVVAVI